MMTIRISDDGLALYLALTVVLIGGTVACLLWTARGLRNARGADTQGRRAGLLRAGGNGVLALLLVVIWFDVVAYGPPHAATLRPDAVELHYRWSTDRIPFADIRDVRHEVRPGRRGRKDIELQIVTATRVCTFVVTSQEPGAAEAVQALARELRGRIEGGEGE